jgi:hypothetical protein
MRCVDGKGVMIMGEERWFRSSAKGLGKHGDAIAGRSLAVLGYDYLHMASCIASEQCLFGFGYWALGHLDRSIRIYLLG